MFKSILMGLKKFFKDTSSEEVEEEKSNIDEDLLQLLTIVLKSDLLFGLGKSND